MQPYKVRGFSADTDVTWCKVELEWWCTCNMSNAENDVLMWFRVKYILTTIGWISEKDIQHS